VKPSNIAALKRHAEVALSLGAGSGEESTYSRWADLHFSGKTVVVSDADLAGFAALDQCEAERIAIVAEEQGGPAPSRWQLLKLAPELVRRNGEIAAIGSQFLGATIDCRRTSRFDAPEVQTFGAGAGEHRRYVQALRDLRSSGEWAQVDGVASFGSLVRQRISDELHAEGHIVGGFLDTDWRQVGNHWQAGQVVRTASAPRLPDAYEVVRYTATHTGGGGWEQGRESFPTLLEARRAARAWVQSPELQGRARARMAWAVIEQAGKQVHNGQVWWRESLAELPAAERDARISRQRWLTRRRH
jgi:hypothetical protein